MNSNKKIGILLGMSAVIFLAGCSSTPRGLQHVPVQPAVVVDPSQTEDQRSFAAAASLLEVGGSATVIQSTPIGLAQATAVSTYKNGLGETCKRIELRNKEASSACGVCLGKDGIWRVVPRNL